MLKLGASMSSKQTWRLTDREVEMIAAALANIDSKFELDDRTDQQILNNLIERFAQAVEVRKPK
jgi:hypothetical protein